MKDIQDCMPSPKKQEKLLQRFMRMPKDYRIRYNLPLALPLPLNPKVWPNAHALIIQENYPGIRPLGESVPISLQDPKSPKELIALIIRIINEAFQAENMESGFYVDMGPAILESKEQGRRITVHSGFQAKYSAIINKAAYNLDYIDMFARITGTSRFLCYQDVKSDKSVCVFFPVIGNDVTVSVYMILLPHYPVKNMSKTWAITTEPENKE